MTDIDIKVNSKTCYRCKKQIVPGDKYHSLKYRKPGRPLESYDFCEDCAPIVEKEIDSGTFKLGQRDKNNHVVWSDIEP